jgi:voltage-gated potassium channel
MERGCEIIAAGADLSDLRCSGRIVQWNGGAGTLVPGSAQIARQPFHARFIPRKATDWGARSIVDSRDESRVSTGIRVARREEPPLLICESDILAPVSTNIRARLLAGFAALAVVVMGGSIGYWFIGAGRWTFTECVYMTVITVTTVGYGEVLDGMAHVPYARGFTIGLLVFGTGSLVYFASTITAFIVEGDLQNILKIKRLQKKMKTMKDHIIVCGAGSTGHHIIEELISTGSTVVAIDQKETELSGIAARFPNAPFTYLVGDATDDELLNQAVITKASGLVAALASDKDNLYLVVSMRQINPNARIIARCAELSHVDKLKRAGADSVVSPNHIGGMRMVSELVRPAVVKFLDEMLRDKRATYRIEQINVGAGKLSGSSLREAKIRERFGMSVLAVRATDDRPWQYNPDADEKLCSGMTMVVLGSQEQVNSLREQLQ